MGNRLRRNAFPIQRNRCVNREVNTVPDLAYYNNTAAGAISQTNSIPINELLLLGNNIETASAISLRLNNGVYDISFSVVAVPTEDGTSSVTLFADNDATNITSTFSSIANNSYTLSARGIYVSTNNSVHLRLINTSLSAQQFSSLNFVVNKLS